MTASDDRAGGPTQEQFYQLMANLSGLDKAEIRWTFHRMAELRKEGMPVAEIKATLKEEVKSKPWLATEGEGA